MRKLLFCIIPMALLASCTTPKTLYSWENYEQTSYNYLKNSDQKSTQELIDNYEKIIKKQTGTRGVVPPGVYADYGFILLQANKTDQGKAMLKKEMELYPESKVFIERILKILEQ
jgi:hypothetical protein